MLSEERVKQFQALYKKRYGKEISYQDALEQGTKLISLLKIIYKPMSKAEFDQLAKRKEETKDL